MTDTGKYPKENGIRDNRGRFVEGNPGGPGRPLGSRNKDPLEPLRTCLTELGNPALMTEEHKRLIIERVMEVLLSPGTKPQDVIRLARFMLEADRINLLATRNQHSAGDGQ